jgi:hypothetical protein
VVHARPGSLRSWEGVGGRTVTRGALINFSSIMPRVMHPFSRYYPGACLVVHDYKYHVPGLLGSISTLAGRAPALQQPATASQEVLTSHASHWPLYASGPGPRDRNNIWDLFGGHDWPDKHFNNSCAWRGYYNPWSAALEQPGKDHPPGGPVRGIFISATRHWPALLDCGVPGKWCGLGGRTHNRDPGSSGPMKREVDATGHGSWRDLAPFSTEPTSGTITSAPHCPASWSICGSFYWTREGLSDPVSARARGRMRGFGVQTI